MGLLNLLLGTKKKSDGMGIFGESSSIFDEIVEKVTAEHLTSENWAMILDICDRINSDTRHPKLALLSIRKRLNHRDPHVMMLALSVLDSCWSNCGSQFRKEVSSANFISELTSKATCSMRPIAEKTRLMVKKWAEGECKTDASLSLIQTMYRNLIADGYSFDTSEPKKKVVISNDPNVVHSQEEEDAIAKAIALSLAEEKKASKLYPSSNGFKSNGNAPSHGSNVYPPLCAPGRINEEVSQLKSILKKVQFENERMISPSPVPSSISIAPSAFLPMSVRGAAAPSSANPGNQRVSMHAGAPALSPISERTVRALYDFEAAEDNELSFVTGDLITVTDDSNPNWWRGRIGVQQGLFPSSFVTSDLSEVKQETTRNPADSRPVATIDESVLLRCIQLLEDCDPTGETADPPELAQVEAAAMAQAPLINARLAAIDRQSNSLAQVDIAIRDVLALYDQAVQQTNPYQANMYQQLPGGMMQQQMHNQPSMQQPATYPYPNQPMMGPTPQHHMQQAPMHYQQQYAPQPQGMHPQQHAQQQQQPQGHAQPQQSVAAQPQAHPQQQQMYAPHPQQYNYQQSSQPQQNYQDWNQQQQQQVPMQPQQY